MDPVGGLEPDVEGERSGRAREHGEIDGVVRRIDLRELRSAARESDLRAVDPDTHANRERVLVDDCDGNASRLRRQRDPSPRSNLDTRKDAEHRRANAPCEPKPRRGIALPLGRLGREEIPVVLVPVRQRLHEDRVQR